MKTYYFLIVISILMIFAIFHKKTKKEGFTQENKFVVKYENNVYDHFYGNIYDDIHIPESRVPYVLKYILKTTQPDNKSTFLVVGSGTGFATKELSDLGYKTYGVDKSASMVEYSTSKYPELMIKNGDVMDSMLYDKQVFSHILCLYYTIYHFQDKQLFFRNCFHWMKSGGYLIVHLIDTEKIDLHIPCLKNIIYGYPKTKKNGNKITANVDFPNFKYDASYTISNKNILFTETFTNDENTRQNEQTFHIENIESIVEMAMNNGFIFHGKINLRDNTMDDFQYIYIFERQL